MDSSRNGHRSDMVRVYLLIENRLLRETLLRLFRKPTDLCVVAQGAPGTTDPAEVENSEWDILVTDHFATDPSPSGPRLSDRWPSLGREILLIGMDENEEDFYAAIRAGSTGYLLKDASASDVVAAVRSVARGEAVCPPRLCMSLVKWAGERLREESPRRSDSKPTLTSRQQQLVSLVAQGLTNKEIASQLNLSEFTVKNHIHRIMKQVDAESRYEVVETVRAYLETS